MRIAVLDDWQGVAFRCADWSQLATRAELVVFPEPFADETAAAEALASFDIIMAMRERTPFPASLVARLPGLKLFNLTGSRGGKIDFAAFHAHGVPVTVTSGGDNGASTAELALTLMLSTARRVLSCEAALRRGAFQRGSSAGIELSGKTLGLIGLGRIGGLMAHYGRALGMTVVAWSPNLTEARAALVGAKAVDKDNLLATADVVSLHMVLAPATIGLIGASDLARLKEGAILVNTARAGLIDQAALVAELHRGRIIAAIDVFDEEPLSLDHPLMQTPNTLLTPHLGYATIETLGEFYTQSIENVLAFLDGHPIRVKQT
jgi:phosphoglycerate dehydrogenase-like enzyme